MRSKCFENCRPAIVSVLMVLTFPVAFAQEPVTDDELLQYATTISKIDSLRENVKDRFNDLVKSDPFMRGGKVYRELEAAKGDSVSISSLKLDEATLAAYQKLTEEYEGLHNTFKEAVAVMIREQLGSTLYHRVRTQLKADKEFEAKLNGILERMKNTSQLEGGPNQLVEGG